MFECDVCKALSVFIFDAKVNVQKMMLAGTEERNHKMPPMETSFQICSLSCLHKAIDEKFDLGMAVVEIKKEEAANGNSPRDPQPNLEEG
jgi:hypothetical protein